MRAVFLEESAHEGGNGFARGESEDVLYVLFGNFFSAEGDELIEHGLGVAHAAICASCDGPSSGFFDGYFFLGGDIKKLLSDDVGRDGPQIEPLAAGNDGGEDFVGLGGGEDEFHVSRGLFQGLQKGIESRVGEHVNFIDVVNFERGLGWCVLHCFAELADLFDSVIGCSVDF